MSKDMLTIQTFVNFGQKIRDDSKTARSPMGGRGGHKKSKNWTQKDTGEKGGGVINFDHAVYEQNVSL